jgi:hypothetical protein
MSRDEEVATLSSVTESEESRVPRVDVSGSVFRPCGRAALGSVMLVVQCVVLQRPPFGSTHENFLRNGPCPCRSLDSSDERR